MSEDFTAIYRPQTFDDFIGNDELIKTLEYQIKHDKLPQVCLFLGPYGTGKTTLARILAQHLIPDKNHRELDVIEVDGGTVSGVADARKIAQLIKNPPMLADYRVWIFDEFHKTSSDGQTALLKVFEEPPEYAYIMVCTTEPQKLIKTIKSRMTKYTTKPLAKSEMITFLEEIADVEGIEVSPYILARIYELTEGHPRDALKILQQGENKKEYEEWEEVLKGTVLIKSSQDLVSALMDLKSWNVVADLLLEIKEAGLNVEDVRRHIANTFANAMISKKGRKYAANSANVVEKFKDNFYDTGFAELVFACYDTWFDLKGN